MAGVEEWGMQFYCSFMNKMKTPAACQADRGAARCYSFMVIIPNNKLQEKRLKKLMGDEYFTKPALRLILSKLEGVQRVEDMDNGRSVEWNDLETERERKIAMVHFWKGFHYAEEWRQMEEALRERGEIE